MAKNIPLGQQVPNIKKALDDAMGEFLLKTQTKLVKDNPADTGRMASSWQVAQGQVRRVSRPEDWAPKGAKKREAEPLPKRIEFDGTWYVSNSVEYASRIAFQGDAGKGGLGGADWYTSIVNQLPTSWGKVLNKHLRKL